MIIMNARGELHRHPCYLYKEHPDIEQQFAEYTKYCCRDQVNSTQRSRKCWDQDYLRPYSIRGVKLIKYIIICNEIIFFLNAETEIYEQYIIFKTHVFIKKT